MRPARLSLAPLRWSLVAVALTSALLACGDAGPSAGTNEPTDRASSALFANDLTACNYFVSKGLTNFQAAGIVGNLDQESGASPTAVQGGGPGRGIAQWSVGGRWDTDANDNATAYASQHGQSVWSLGLQLDFIWYELTTFSGYGLSQLRATTNVTDATVVFQDRFEGCGTCVQSQRVAYAQAVLAQCAPASNYGAQYVSQSFPLATTTMTMVEGEVVPSFIELKNTGTKTWDSNTRIGTTQARDRQSAFANGTWISPSRLAKVNGTVPPGGTYKFQFDLAAPMMPGTYDEHFGVVQEGVTWFGDPGQGGPPDGDLEVKIQVTPPLYRGAFKDQSFPRSPAPLTVHVGDVAKGYIELTNTGTQTWKAGVTKLAPIPRDKPSPFADSSWLSPTRVSSVVADVAPGAVGRFEVALDAKAIGDTKVPFGIVEESVTWFADSPGGAPADGLLEVHLVVVPQGAPVDGGMTPPSGGDGGPGNGSPDGAAPGSGSDGGDSIALGVDAGASGGCSVTARGDASSWAGLFVMLVASVIARRRR